MFKTRKKIGFVIGQQLDKIRLLHPDRIPSDATGFMRFGWVSDKVNSSPEYGLKYEIYRPWHRYDMIIFAKSMGPRSMKVLRRNKQKGKKVIFDANVNYYEIWGKFYYDGMSPTGQQRLDAIEITRMADAVIADSTFLENSCRKYNPEVCWIPDNVNVDMVPARPKSKLKLNGRLSLLWSGQAIKLFELLAIENVLRKYKEKIHLLLITNSLSEIDSWYDDYKSRFLALLNDIEHEIVPFQSIAQLLDIYSNGGVCIAPRFLDNSYNMGHTEWKITLGMACRNIALCSPLPSYVDVAERAENGGIRVCHTPDEWDHALDEILAKDRLLDDERDAARSLVEKYYSTESVAAKHAAFVQNVLTL
jgi:glycosyltransferase involved in cell wall biosynthesis